jgi:hypothetical protein
MISSTSPLGRVIRWPFVGKAGLRGGWLCFIAMFIVGSEVMEAWLPQITQGAFTAPRILVKESLLLALVAGATLCLGAFERRGLGDYGLPARGVRRGQ